MLNFAAEQARSGGTGGVSDLVPFLGVSSPLIQLAYEFDLRVQRGQTGPALARSIAQGCARRANPVLSADELDAVEHVAVPADARLLRRIKITR